MFFSSHWCLVPWFTETKPSRPSSHSTWRSWPPPNRRQVRSFRQHPRMLPHRDRDGGPPEIPADWKRLKKTQHLPQSQWLANSRLGSVSRTRTRGCASPVLSVWVSSSKTSENQHFLSVCKQPVRGAGPLPSDHDWFSSLCFYMCFGSWLALKFHQVALFFFSFSASVSEVKTLTDMNIIKLPAR